VELSAAVVAAGGVAEWRREGSVSNEALRAIDIAVEDINLVTGWPQAPQRSVKSGHNAA
jgi:hypothetical protein